MQLKKNKYSKGGVIVHQCLGLFSVVMEHKSNLEEKGLQVTVHLLRETEAGTEAKTMEEHCPKTRSLCFLIQPRPICPGVTPPTVGGAPTFIKGIRMNEAQVTLMGGKLTLKPTITDSKMLTSQL